MEIGIVGLPNVGKSTLFNALLKKQAALVANYPFATIEPNVGVVPVPDPRLGVLAEVVHTEKIVPATVKFVDIAGLVKGASEGEGLGNKFLAHIREVDAILYLLRDFSDENIVRAGSTNPKDDYEILKLELELGNIINKPEIVVYNTDEDKLKGGGLRICAKLEEGLAALSEEEQREYLKQLGIDKTGLEKVIQAAFEILGLQTFLTAGEIEARAWTIKNGTKAPQAAGVIHTDFEKKFIRAEVVEYSKLLEAGSHVAAKSKGWVRTEGKEYVMRDGDIVEFLIGS